MCSLPPSPNWFTCGGLQVADDGTLLYPSCANGITLLRPADETLKVFAVSNIYPAHRSRVTCLSLSPSWIESEEFVSSGDDGFVKLWNAKTLTVSIAHDVHHKSKDIAAGVVFSAKDLVVSVGLSGVLCVWNVKTNKVKSDTKLLKLYKPICVSECPNKEGVISVGMKNGVIVVISVEGDPSILFKVHGHDTEIVSMSWCPTVGCDSIATRAFNKLDKVTAKRKELDDFPKHSSTPMKSNDAKNIPDQASDDTELSFNEIESNAGDVNDSDIFDIYKDHSVNEFGHKKNVYEMPDLKNFIPKITEDETETPELNSSEVKSFMGECEQLKRLIISGKSDDESTTNMTNCSTTVVNDSDIFDRYKDITCDEFGHSKDTKEAIVEDKVEKDTTSDFLKECEAVKNMILKTETDSESENVDSMLNETNCNTTVVNDSDIFDRYKDITYDEFGHAKDTKGAITEDKVKKETTEFLKECEAVKNMILKTEDDSKSEIEDVVKKFDAVNLEQEPDDTLYFASGCKHGKVCIWGWGGRLIATSNLNTLKTADGKKHETKSHPWVAIHWLSSSNLLMAKNTQLFKCNFPTMNFKTKRFGCSVLHSEHWRGLFAISSSKAKEESDWRKEKSPIVWTIGQDRLLIGYSMDDNQCVAKYTTFGGYVYDMAISPIDLSRIAIAGGDGIVRVWDRTFDPIGINPVDDIQHYWNGIQGRVRSVAWHPIKENCLAYATTEGRIGLLDVGSSKSAKVLPPGLRHGVYHICWGNSNQLFGCGGGELVVYNTANPRKDCGKIEVIVQEQKWAVSTMSYGDDFLTIGSSDGAVALLETESPFQAIVSAYPHKKSIQWVKWHPKALLLENEVSPYSNLLAVSASALTVIVLQYNEGEKKLDQYAQFSMHSEKVKNISWNPHKSAQLLSVSDDCSIQVWDVANKCILHTIVGHQEAVLCALWCPLNSQHIISAGEDHTVRVWEFEKFPPLDLTNIKKKQRKKTKMASSQGDNASQSETAENGKDNDVAKDISDLKPVFDNSIDEMSHATAMLVNSKKKSKKHSCLNIASKQLRATSNTSEGCSRLFKWIQRKNSNDDEKDCRPDYNDGFDYLRLYGTHDDIIELLQLEVSNHEEAFNWSGWCLVKMLSGDLKTVLERAGEKNKLTPSLVSLAPFVSLRFWKDTMQIYSNQLKNFSERDSIQDTLATSDIWNGLIMLCSSQFDDACDTLLKDSNFIEALCAVHARYANHLINKCLTAWIADHLKKQKFTNAAECYLAQGQLMEAAITLGKSTNENDLLLAADIAKYAGNLSLAEGVKQHVGLK